MGSGRFAGHGVLVTGGGEEIGAATATFVTGAQIMGDGGTSGNRRVEQDR
ncbi:hypothetical protein [Pseudonocardia spinosispora]|nr:hypothetical protein [Pseudonocardia spinosispora]